MVCPAPNCSASFVGNKLDEHLKTCRNLSSLQCETCEELFKNPMSKCRHKKKGGCKAPEKPSPVWSCVNIVDSPNATVNITNTVNNTTVNNTVNNYVIISPVPTNSFGYEDIDVVKIFLARNPEIVKYAESVGAMDSTLWLTTHKQFPENDNLVGMYRNGGDVKVKVDGEVRNVWTQKVFQKMIENNNKIIASPELTGLTSSNIWKSLGAGSRKDLDRKRHRLAKELLVNKMKSDLPDINNPLEFVPRQQDIPLVVDFTESVDKFYKCFVEFNHEPDTARFVNICSPFCTSAGLFYRTRWWIVGRSTINGEEISVFKLSTKNEIFEVLRERIVQFKELLVYDHCRKCGIVPEHIVNSLDVDTVSHGVLETL